MSQKLESTLKNMVLSLLLIAAVMAAALGFVYSVTREPIEKANKQKEVQAVKEVLPPFDNDPTTQAVTKEGLVFYPATKGGQAVGCAVKTFTDKGFSGHFELMVGFKPDGTIYKTVVLEQKETPGLGTKMKEPKFKNQFDGLNPGTLTGKVVKVKKDGGTIDAITAATISSRAFCDGIQKAYDLYMKDFATAKQDSTTQETGGAK